MVLHKGDIMITVDDMNKGIAIVVGQDDDNDYQESGWVALVKGNEAAMFHYSHCSCYGTWDDFIDGWDWRGSVDELIQLAQLKLDPVMPSREADTEDYDYDHLMETYNQILEWAKSR
jgi:hypothetical protein